MKSINYEMPEPLKEKDMYNYSSCNRENTSYEDPAWLCLLDHWLTARLCGESGDWERELLATLVAESCPVGR